MTDEEAATIAARAGAATPGEWECWDKRGRPFYDKHPSLGGRIVGHSGEDDFGILIGGRNHSMNTVADATFIAHARADIPALLAERAALREIVRVVASERVILPVGDPAEDQCPFCYGEDPIARSERATVEHSLDGWFIHRPDCVVLKARAQVEGKQP